MRRVHRIAYRMAQLAPLAPGLRRRRPRAWQRDPAWQPLREAGRALLVTYDWGEAFVALNLCLKPALDELFMVDVGRAGARPGDYLLGEILLLAGRGLPLASRVGA